MAANAHRLIGLTLCVALTGCAKTPDPLLTLKQVGPDVWAAIDGPATKWSAGANAGFVIGKDGVLVVDTFANPAATQQLLSDIRRRTAAPIRFVVDTHYHMDHVAGNGVFKDAGAPILAQRNVRGWIHDENLRLVTEGMRSEGKDVPPEQRAFIAALVPPTVTYDAGVELSLGSRDVRVKTFAGHTGGDSVVLIPDAHVVFCGDLLWRATLPTLTDASTEPLIETLAALAQLEPTGTFVPGHGDVATPEDVTAFRDYIAALRSSVADGRAQGKSGAALADAVSPALAEKYGRWAFFAEQVKGNIRDVEAEMNGTKRIPHAY